MPSFHGDVGVKDGKIVASGKLDGLATRTIDVDGRVISPGFIDNHCHYDAQVTWDPLCTFSCYHGVTTLINGNCSLALAPVRPGDQEILLQMLARVEAIPLDTLRTGTVWSWETVSEYMDALDQRLGPNVGVLMGHSAVRRYVMGDASWERDATGEEIEGMKAVVRDGMAAGALGISFNRNPGHFDTQGKLLPGCVAPAEELLDLAAVLGEMGTGIIASGASSAPELRDGLMSALAETSGRPVHYLQISQRPSDPDQWKEHLAFAEAKIKQGLRVYPTVTPRSVVRHWTMKNAQVFDRFPAWGPIMTGSDQDKVTAFANQDLRARLSSEAVDGVGLGAGSSALSWDGVFVTEAALPKNRELQGKSVAQIAREQGKGVLDAFLDLVLEEDLGTEFKTIQQNNDEKAMDILLNSPYTVIGMSDAGAHIAFGAQYGLSTYFLDHWVREKGIMPLEQGVRRLTFEQASLFGLHDRGLISPGMAADLVVFDPDTIAAAEPESAYDLPEGAMRVKELAHGIDYTVVNGQVLMEGGEHTGVYPGRVVRNSLYRANGA
jgi:N-acyl-D-aspartate/D-glutamate deacylase